MPADVLDIAQAQRETVIEPDRMADDFDRIPIPLMSAPPQSPQRPILQAPTRHQQLDNALAEAGVSVCTLMTLLGHESIATSQLYVEAAGRETRAAAATNPLYELVKQAARHSG